jgi:hypothetical protein
MLVVVWMQPLALSQDQQQCEAVAAKSEGICLMMAWQDGYALENKAGVEGLSCSSDDGKKLRLDEGCVNLMKPSFLRSAAHQ